MPQLPIMIIVACAFGNSPVLAELPTLEEKAWLGHFVGFENNHYRFGFTSMGAGILTPMGKSGPAGKDKQVEVSFIIEEILPDGKVAAKKLVPESLESEQEATKKPVEIKIAGKVTGGAAFEGFIHEERGVIFLGGKLLEPGTLTNPVRFGIRVEFGAPYRYVAAAEREGKAFQKRIRQDELRLIWTDGKRVKQPGADPVTVEATELNGPGIAKAEFEADAFQGKEFILEAAPGSKMVLSNKPATPLIDGFALTWYPDDGAGISKGLRLTVK